MNVRIISPYTDDLDITLIEENPSVESINNDFILLENYEYEIQIYLECFDDIENIELFIGDIAVPLNFNISSGCYQTNRGTLFSDAFDLVKFSLLIEDIYGYETIYHSKYIRVATSKQTLEQVEKMISEIEVDLPNFIEACFSSHFRESGLEKNKSHSISSVISIVNEIIDIYEEQYAFFSNQRKSKVISIPSIVDLRDMEYLNQDSLSWIVNNPDMLIKSNATHGIKFDDENYIPLKIKTYISKYSSDIYENQIVLGFLKLVFRYLNKIIDIFKEKLECLIQVPEKILSQIPEGYGLTDRCIHFYYSQIIKLFGNQYEK